MSLVASLVPKLPYHARSVSYAYGECSSEWNVHLRWAPCCLLGAQYRVGAVFTDSLHTCCTSCMQVFGQLVCAPLSTHTRDTGLEVPYWLQFSCVGMSAAAFVDSESRLLGHRPGCTVSWIILKTGSLQNQEECKLERLLQTGGITK